MPLEADLDPTVTADTVEFVFTVENTGTDPVDLDFRSGQAADVTVVRDDDEAWRWSDGRLFTQALRSETVAPGDSRVYEMTWETPEPGTYEAVATLEAANVSVEAQAGFEVEG